MSALGMVFAVQRPRQERASVRLRLPMATGPDRTAIHVQVDTMALDAKCALHARTVHATRARQETGPAAAIRVSTARCASTPAPGARRHRAVATVHVTKVPLARAYARANLGTTDRHVLGSACPQQALRATATAPASIQPPATARATATPDTMGTPAATHALAAPATHATVMEHARTDLLGLVCALAMLGTMVWIAPPHVRVYRAMSALGMVFAVQRPRQERASVRLRLPMATGPDRTAIHVQVDTTAPDAKCALHARTVHATRARQETGPAAAIRVSMAHCASTPAPGARRHRAVATVHVTKVPLARAYARANPGTTDRHVLGSACPQQALRATATAPASIQPPATARATATPDTMGTPAATHALAAPATHATVMEHARTDLLGLVCALAMLGTMVWIAPPHVRVYRAMSALGMVFAVQRPRQERASVRLRLPMATGPDRTAIRVQVDTMALDAKCALHARTVHATRARQETGPAAAIRVSMAHCASTPAPGARRHRAVATVHVTKVPLARAYARANLGTTDRHVLGSACPQQALRATATAPASIQPPATARATATPDTMGTPAATHALAAPVTHATVMEHARTDLLGLVCALAMLGTTVWIAPPHVRVYRAMSALGMVFAVQRPRQERASVRLRLPMATGPDRTAIHVQVDTMALDAKCALHARTVHATRARQETGPAAAIRVSTARCASTPAPGARRHRAVATVHVTKVPLARAYAHANPGTTDRHVLGSACPQQALRATATAPASIQPPATARATATPDTMGTPAATHALAAPATHATVMEHARTDLLGLVCALAMLGTMVWIAPPHVRVYRAMSALGMVFAVQRPRQERASVRLRLPMATGPDRTAIRVQVDTMALDAKCALHARTVHATRARQETGPAAAIRVSMAHCASTPAPGARRHRAVATVHVTKVPLARAYARANLGTTDRHVLGSACPQQALRATATAPASIQPPATARATATPDTMGTPAATHALAAPATHATVMEYARTDLLGLVCALAMLGTMVWIAPPHVRVYRAMSALGMVFAVQRPRQERASVRLRLPMATGPDRTAIRVQVDTTALDAKCALHARTVHATRARQETGPAAAIRVSMAHCASTPAPGARRHRAVATVHVTKVPLARAYARANPGTTDRHVLGSACPQQALRATATAPASIQPPATARATATPDTMGTPAATHALAAPATHATVMEHARTDLLGLVCALAMLGTMVWIAPPHVRVYRAMSALGMVFAVQRPRQERASVRLRLPTAIGPVRLAILASLATTVPIAVIVLTARTVHAMTV